MQPRYIDPVLLASHHRAIIVGSTGAFLAATIATAFKSRATDSEASDLHEAALAAQSSLAVRIPVDERRRLIDLAEAVRNASKVVPHEDRVAVVACIVRELLVDAPSSCIALDRAVRNACERRYETTDEHRACAQRIVAKVMS